MQDNRPTEDRSNLWANLFKAISADENKDQGNRKRDSLADMDM